MGRRARTMKALHFGEKSLRSVVNLNDDRFKLKEEAILLDQMAIAVDTNSLDERPVNVSNKRKRVTFSKTINEITVKDECTIEKKRKSNTNDFNKNIICGGTGEGILNVENNGNILFLSLIEARRVIYTVSDDQAKFQEVCNVMKVMKEISPRSKFVQYDDNDINRSFTELSWEDAMERTIHMFCNTNLKPLSVLSRNEKSVGVEADIHRDSVLQESVHFDCNDILDDPDKILSTELSDELATLILEDNIGADENMNMSCAYEDELLDSLLLHENEQNLPDDTDYLHSILV